MKKSSTTIFVFFLFFTGINCFAGDDDPTYSTTDNYSWVSEAYRYTYQLKDSDGNYTTIIDNQSLYFLKEGRQAGSLEEAFSGALPSSGTYTGGKFIFKAWIVKAWAVINGTTWYTNNTTDSSFEYQYYATDNVSKYGEWTLDVESMSAFQTTGGIVTEQTFYTPLVIGDENVILTGLNVSDPNDGIATTDNATSKWEHGIYFEKERLFKGLVLGEPKKMIRINYNATASGQDNMTGDVVLLLDANGTYLDGNFYRGHRGNIPRTLVYALRAMKAEFTGLSSDGLSGNFKIRFQGSDDYAYKNIEGSYNCNTGSATLSKIQSLNSDLSVVATLNAGETSPDAKILQGNGWLLSGTGTTTCKDLN